MHCVTPAELWEVSARVENVWGYLHQLYVSTSHGYKKR